MRLLVQVKPKSARANVEKISETEYLVSVTVPPEKGLANRAVIELLAEYFHVPVSRVRIIIGHTARHKIIRIDK